MAEFQSPQTLAFGNPGRREGQVTRTHTPVLVSLKAASQERGRVGEKKHTHLFLYKVSYLIWS